MRDFWDAIEDLDNRIEAGTQLSMLLEGRRLVERATRWLGRARARTEIDVTQTAHHFAAGVRELYAGDPQRAHRPRPRRLRRPAGRADRGRRGARSSPVASPRCRRCCRCSTSSRTPPHAAAPRRLATRVYFGIGQRLSLDWLRDRVLELPRSDRWQALARSALRDDLYELHRTLTREILRRGGLEGRRGGGRDVAGRERRVGRRGRLACSATCARPRPSTRRRCRSSCAS